jgi:regulator of protease activity HflC (stomatin/prohibitin superfamily)
MAVTQDNGRQIILEGGAVYLLTHKNWKFETFVSTKIQTDTLTRIEASSADNVIMLVDATVLWRIKDVNMAVLMSAETMSATGKSSTSRNEISHTAKLRNDVIKQALASLSFFIGTINFSDSMAAAAMNQRTKESQSQRVPIIQAESFLNAPEAPDAVFEEFNLYNNEKLHDAVVHANEVTERYGVEIISINIISAIPKDTKLQASLAAGAVAAAEAQMMETSAQGRSRAMRIEAVATAKQTMILAQASADADVVRAEGAKKAADLLATNPVSVELSKIRTTGEALAGSGNHTSFFFGADPKDVSTLLANSNIVRGTN